MNADGRWHCSGAQPIVGEENQEDLMQAKDYWECFATAPFGLKLIILFYGLTTAFDIYDLFYDFGFGGVFGLALSLALFLGMLLRWNAVRSIIRFVIGFFFVGMVIAIIRSTKFRATAMENATFWTLCWIPAVMTFIYLGTSNIKSLFRHQELPREAE